MAINRVFDDENLYIGGIFALRRPSAIEQAEITHVLSVLRQPLDQRMFDNYKHEVIEVDDVDDENILEHLPRSVKFIRDGLQEGKGVLVHCAMGKSRSATCVIAYMMQKHGLTPGDALERLRESRPLCEPNPGFMKQLSLFHRMGCAMELDEQPIYQRWLYQRDVEENVACGQAPEKVRFEDEHDGEETKQRGAEKEFELRCRKCRRILTTSRYLAQHPPQGSDTSSSEDEDNPPEDVISRPTKSTQKSIATVTLCSHYFLDPMSWMREELEQGKLEGRLECPKCQSNVGKYAWQGMKCSCGAWIIPGISLARGRVDEVKARHLDDP